MKKPRSAYICQHCYTIATDQRAARERYCTTCRQHGISDDEAFARVEAIVEQCKPLFAGEQPYVVGAALADLVAIWLASHLTADKAETDDLRQRMLRHHTRFVRAFLPDEEQAVLAILRAKRQ